MSITRELADILHRINALLPHREEGGQLAIGQAIEQEVDKPAEDVDKAADSE